MNNNNKATRKTRENSRKYDNRRFFVKMKINMNKMVEIYKDKKHNNQKYEE